MKTHLPLLLAPFLFFSCTKQTEYVTFVAEDFSARAGAETAAMGADEKKFQRVYDSMSEPFKAHFSKAGSATEFLADLQATLRADTDDILILCDKTHYLPDGYTPDDLLLLENNDFYSVSRGNLYLRQCAEIALREMAKAAKSDGATLLVSSTYRSFRYQQTVYNRLVEQEGQEEADRESAKPGTSQHQTGCVVDFGSIDEDYEKTKAGKWLLENASRFGWSLSFPDGYEDVTGYKYECWHFRYLGTEACAFQKKWFGDIQQFMLEFIDEWKKQ